MNTCSSDLFLPFFVRIEESIFETSLIFCVLPNIQFVCVVKFGLIDCRISKSLASSTRKPDSVTPCVCIKEHVDDKNFEKKNEIEVYF